MPFKTILNFWKNIENNNRVNLKNININRSSSNLRSSDNIKNMILKTTFLTGGHFLIKKIISSFTLGTILLTVLETLAFQSKIYLPILNITNSCIEKITNVWFPTESIIQPLIEITTNEISNEIGDQVLQATLVGCATVVDVIINQSDNNLAQNTADILSNVTPLASNITPVSLTIGYYLLTGSIILIILGPAGAAGAVTGVAVTKLTTGVILYSGIKSAIVAKSIGVTAGIVSSVISYKIVKNYINDNNTNIENVSDQIE